MLRLTCYLVLITTVSTRLTTEAFAQKPAKSEDYAAVYLDEVDADFAYQGEYAGTIDDKPAGLQVIAFGGGKFEALLLDGGLPGAGWNGESQWRMSAVREGDSLVFRREVYQTGEASEKSEVHYQVADETVTVKSGEKSLGTLEKVIRKSPTLGEPAPWGAVKLFDGDDLYQFQGGKITEEGWLEEGTETKDPQKDFLLHVEFRLPYMPYATGQKRSNSGCYLQSRYEVQILDSFGLDLEFNHCGALYRYQPPNLNMCLPPLQWQTYDIEFKAARFNDKGEKIKNAVITVWHNGVKIHDKFELERKTGAGKQEGPEPLTTKFQDHRNPVRFRNMWIIDLNQPIPSPAAHPGFQLWHPEQVVSR